MEAEAGRSSARLVGCEEFAHLTQGAVFGRHCSRFVVKLSQVGFVYSHRRAPFLLRGRQSLSSVESDMKTKKSRSQDARLGLERLEARDVPVLIGSLDPTFGTGGKALLDFGLASEQANA